MLDVRAQHDKRKMTYFLAEQKRCVCTEDGRSRLAFSHLYFLLLTVRRYAKPWSV